VTQELDVFANRSVKHYIRTTEEICRFLIVSFHDGLWQDGFDAVQNTERLTEGLSKLQYSYNEIKQLLARKMIDPESTKHLLKNDAEFTSYSLIANHAVHGA